MHYNFCIVELLLNIVGIEYYWTLWVLTHLSASFSRDVMCKINMPVMASIYQTSFFKMIGAQNKTFLGRMPSIWFIAAILTFLVFYTFYLDVLHWNHLLLSAFNFFYRKDGFPFGKMTGDFAAISIWACALTFVYSLSGETFLFKIV